MEEMFILMDMNQLQENGEKRYLTQDQKGHTPDPYAAGRFTHEAAMEIVRTAPRNDSDLPGYIPFSMSATPEDYKKDVEIFE